MNEWQKHDCRVIITLMSLPCLLLCLTFLFPFYLNGRDDAPTKMAMTLANAAKKSNKIPVLSINHPTLNPVIAYRVQKSYISLSLKSQPGNKIDKIAGFKAGLTSPGAMKRFGLDQPVAGVLLTSGKITGHNPITPPNSNAVIMLECEIGFIADRAIHQPIRDETTLKAFFQRAAPVIELPNLGYTDMKRLTGPDIIASNVGAAGFVIGPDLPVKNINPDIQSVTLTHNGKTVNNGKGSDAMEGQWKALIWLVNHTVKQGWAIMPGQILITGAMGKMIPARPGKYKADYGAFGVIEFVVNGEQ